MDADDESVIDIDSDGDRPSGTRTVSTRHRALILIKHIALVALILIIYIRQHLIRSLAPHCPSEMF